MFRLCLTICEEVDVVGIGVVGFGQLWQVVVEAQLAGDLAAEHLVGLKLDAGVEEFDGSTLVTHEHVSAIGIHHLGIVQHQCGLGVGIQSLEGSDVGHCALFGGVATGNERLGDVDLVFAFVWHENAYGVIGVVLVPFTHPHLETVIELYAVVADVSIVVGVLSFFLGHYFHALDLDELTVVGFRLCLCDGHQQWHCRAGRRGVAAVVGVVGLRQFGNVVVFGRLAGDFAVHHLSFHEIDAGLVEVDGTRSVAHIHIVGSHEEHLGVVQRQRGLSAVGQCLEGGNAGSHGQSGVIATAADGLGDGDLILAVVGQQDAFHVIGVGSVPVSISHLELVIDLNAVAADVGIHIGIGAFLFLGQLHTLDFQQVAVVGGRLGLCDGHHLRSGSTCRGSETIVVRVFCLCHLRGVVITGRLASHLSVKHLSGREGEVGTVEVDGCRCVAHVYVVRSHEEHLGVVQRQRGLGAIFHGVEGGNVGGHGEVAGFLLDEGLLGHRTKVACEVFLHGLHRGGDCQGERTAVGLAGAARSRCAAVDGVVYGEVSVRGGDGHRGLVGEGRGAADGGHGLAAANGGFHFLHSPVAASCRTGEGHFRCAAGPCARLGVEGARVYHVARCGPEVVARGEGQHDLGQVARLGFHHHLSVSIHTYALASVVVFAVVGTTYEGHGEVASVERVAILHAVLEAQICKGDGSTPCSAQHCAKQCQHEIT